MSTNLTDPATFIIATTMSVEDLKSTIGLYNRTKDSLAPEHHEEIYQRAITIAVELQHRIGANEWSDSVTEPTTPVRIPAGSAKPTTKQIKVGTCQACDSDVIATTDRIKQETRFACTCSFAGVEQAVIMPRGAERVRFPQSWNMSHPAFSEAAR